MNRKNLWATSLALFLFLGAAFLPAVNAGAGDVEKRNFVLIFEILDYNNDIGNAVRYFFQNVIRPGDQLIVYTPAKVYGFSPAKLSRPFREQAAELQQILKADTASAAARYRDIITAMRQIVADGGADAEISEANLVNYRNQMDNMRQMRQINENMIAGIANVFKGQPGNHHLILFFQAEFRPIPKKETIDRMKENPRLGFHATTLFLQDQVEKRIDSDIIKETLTNAGVPLHLVYFRGRTLRMSTGQQKEHSLDVWNAFKEVAAATGGRVESAAAVEAALKSLQPYLK